MCDSKDKSKNGVVCDNITLRLNKDNFKANQFFNAKDWNNNIITIGNIFIINCRTHYQHTKVDGEYMPSLSFDTYNNVYLEFNAPKILFNNNLEEITDEDFGTLIQALYQKIALMGFDISINALWNAEVRRIHFAKTIISSYSFEETLQYLQSCYSPKLSKRKTRETLFLNNIGMIGNNSMNYNSSVYNKHKEVEKETTGQESNFYSNLDVIDFLDEHPNLTRIECKLAGFKKIKEVLNLQSDMITFKEIFNSDYNKIALLNYIQKKCEYSFNIPLDQIPMLFKKIKKAHISYPPQIFGLLFLLNFYSVDCIKHIRKFTPKELEFFKTTTRNFSHPIQMEIRKQIEENIAIRILN